MTDLLEGTAAEPAAVPRRPSLVDRLSAVLDSRTGRRGFLARAAVVGSALAVSPVQVLLRPGTAYAAVCGVDSACSSGYTVFCCTINNGINRCPPGSLVGGWWKSDNSGFCCGSARYYIDCHSYCSCGCGGGSRFCGEGCRSCSCGCGPGGQCDQRRVCCNNFRYGQCTQDVTCTGPVWCRVVTCTPPWRVAAWRCTTTSATDQRTGSHGAPGLVDCTAINSLYSALGGPGSYLGEAVTGEQPGAAGGAKTHYDFGSIYWSGATGAHEVHGEIRRKWWDLGAEGGGLGYPTTSEVGAPDAQGRYNDFAGSGGASVYWHPSYGAHAMWGAIRAKWIELGHSPALGFPTTDETASGDGVGRYSVFSGAGGASVHWHPAHGAHGVWGAIRACWQSFGAEVGGLGYPTSSERVCADGVGRVSTFSGAGGASIYWHPRTGAHAVWGEIRRAYFALGAEAGGLGYPSSSETASPDGVGRFNTFDGAGGATIIWHPESGARGVWGAIRGRWRDLGGENGPLGYPVTDELAAPGGRGRYVDFRGGGPVGSPRASVYWSAATGAHSVSGPVRAAWLDRGGSAGELGLPTAEPVTVSGGRIRQDFEGGSVVHNPSDGTTTVTPT